MTGIASIIIIVGLTEITSSSGITGNTSSDEGGSQDQQDQ